MFNGMSLECKKEEGNPGMEHPNFYNPDSSVLEVQESHKRRIREKKKESVSQSAM